MPDLLWNVETLHEHHAQRFSDLDKRLDERATAQRVAVDAALLAQEKAVAAALAAAEKAVNKAELAQQRVNESQNEFRGTLKDQASMLMPRSETETLVRGLREQIDELKGSDSRRRGSDKGRGTQSSTLLTIGSVAVAVASVVLAAAR